MLRILRNAARATLCAAAFLAPVSAFAQARNYLWEVVSVTGKAYLFGTVHAGKATWYPLPPGNPVTPPPTADQLEPSHLAILLALTPPAVLNDPPA